MLSSVRGRQSPLRRSGPQPRVWTRASPGSSMFRWLCTIPFGTPVVPLVKAIPAGASGSTSTRGAAGALATRPVRAVGPMRAPKSGGLGHQLVGQPEVGRRYAEQTRDPEQLADITDLTAAPLDHGNIGLVHLQQLTKRGLAQMVDLPVLAEDLAKPV